ncbi:MAG: F0F1 ATP synthase subunit B [Thermodesulfovibrionales bacterium]|nr:F0F1 ATP synthase subunit B [Thermodesulfovibrionales bacterium]
MLEFNKWFFVLLINFLFLIFILNIILFKPLMRLFEERKEGIDGSLKKAREFNQKKEELMNQLNRELLEANRKAKEIIERYTQEGKDRQAELLRQAEKEAQEILMRARQDIAAATEEARKALRQEIEKISEDIVNKLVRV